MSAYTDDDVTAATEVALSYGAAPGSSLHSWRCEDKERYPESCTCVTEMAHEIVTTVAPAIAARALREAADAWPGYLPPDVSSVATWLRARADELRNGSAPARETVVQFDMDPRLPVSEGSGDE